MKATKLQRFVRAVTVFACIHIAVPNYCLSFPLKTMLGGIGSLGLALYANDISKTAPLQWLGKNFSTHPHDLSKGLAWSIACLSASRITKNTMTKKILYAYSILPSILGIIIPNKYWNSLHKIPILKHYFSCWKYMRCIPIVGSFLTCSNKECQGICSSCKVQCIYQIMPLILGGYFGGKIVLKKMYPTEFEKRIHAPIQSTEECCICLENYETKVGVRLTCGHPLHKECAQKTFFKHKGPNVGCRCEYCKPSCPICNEKMGVPFLRKLLFN